MKRIKMTTTTTLVIEALNRADDFQTVSQLMLATGRTNNRVTAALHHLRKHHAVETMQVEGSLYWYPTPRADTRSRVVEEKAEEDKPRKTRARRLKKNQDLLS